MFRTLAAGIGPSEDEAIDEREQDPVNAHLLDDRPLLRAEVLFAAEILRQFIPERLHRPAEPGSAVYHLRTERTDRPYRIG